VNYLPRLASNRDPLDLCLLSKDYRHDLPVPGLVVCVLDDNHSNSSEVES
jgi:hypothetical protein